MEIAAGNAPSIRMIFDFSAAGNISASIGLLMEGRTDHG